MNNKIIRLTESDLHRIVKESVKRALNEIETVGKIPNFNPNKSYAQINGMYADNQRIMAIAKKKLLNIISEPFKIQVSASEDSGDAWGYFDETTADGWNFYAEDIPLDLIIDDYSYDEPASWDSPGGYSDTVGHVENIDIPTEIWFCTPGQNKPNSWQRIQFDETIKSMFAKNAEEDDDISDALHDMETYERDYQAGLYDEYINNKIDAMRGN